jgi:hypothetical protein
MPGARSTHSSSSVRAPRSALRSPSHCAALRILSSSPVRTLLLRYRACGIRARPFDAGAAVCAAAAAAAAAAAPLLASSRAGLLLHLR